jgi:hypothetical protein
MRKADIYLFVHHHNAIFALFEVQYFIVHSNLF